MLKTLFEIIKYMYLFSKDAKVIGPTTIKPSKDLPKGMETFMQSASEGVLLVSFGSIANSLDDRRASILVEAFSMLKYKVNKKPIIKWF